MPSAAVFRGDGNQMRALLNAIEHNCTCASAADGTVKGDCPAHRALLDQRFLDHMLFGWWLRDQLLAEELRAR